MLKKKDKAIDRVCYGCYEMISVPREVFGSNLLIRREYKGRTLENRIVIGEIVFYCNDSCRDLALGPRPEVESE